MAICNYCNTEMTTSSGCTISVSTIDGVPYDRIKWRSPEENKLLDAPDSYQGREVDRCHDCAALPDNFHHPGCDMERCPKCHKQAIGCACDAEDV